MPEHDSTKGTRWTIIRGAARGSESDRTEFVRLYESVVRAYLRGRWPRPDQACDVDDAVQEVFMDCFREGGALDRAEADRAGGFRAFLYGIVRRVALRFEGRRDRRRGGFAAESLHWSEIPADEAGLSTVFDRSWARALLHEAAEIQTERARERGEEARRRVELLRLRFQEGLPIREIARRWEMDPARLHHAYATARREFQSALHEVVAMHHPGSKREIDRECSRILESLG